MKKAFQFTLNELLYKKLWAKNSWCLKTIYIIIPWILLAILYCFLYIRDALLIDGAYGFLNDFTNLFALSYVFIFIYYVSGYYSSYSNSKSSAYMNRIASKEKRSECQSRIDKVSALQPYIHIFATFACLFSMWFIYITHLNGAKNWYEKMIPWYLPYYCILIAMTWYMSATVLLRTLVESIKFYEILDFDLSLKLTDSDMGCGLKDFFRFIFINVGIALYFVIWISIIVFSDYRAVQYDVYNTFYLYPIICLPIILLLVIYLAITALPFFKAKSVIDNMVDEELKKYEYPDRHIDELMKIKHSMFSFRNIILPVFTNLLPIMVSSLMNWLLK